MLKVYCKDNVNLDLSVKPRLGSSESLMVGDRVTIPINTLKIPGQLYTWGRATEGQLGQNIYRFPPNCCALPRPVKGLHNVVHISCGGGVQGCTAAVTITGKVFTFGNNFKGRLGYKCNTNNDNNNTSVPRQVETIADSHVLSVACGLGHMICLTSDGKVYSWGTNSDGCLGNDKSQKQNNVNNNRTTTNSNNCVMIKMKTSDTQKQRKKTSRKIAPSLPKYVLDLEFGMSSLRSLQPSSNTFDKYKYNRNCKKKNASALILYNSNSSKTNVETNQVYLNNVLAIDACGNVSASILKDGRLCLWGRNKSGELGNGDYSNRALPTLVKQLDDVRQISVGSRYCAAVTNAGEIYTWGYGGSGNLGIGNRKSYNVPQRVMGLISNVHMQFVACSKNQDCGVTMGYHGTKPSPGGHQGPHTVALTIYGEVYTWGTAYSGALGNVGKKTKCLGQNWDELLPYKFGSAVRNNSKHRKDAPLSPYAVWPAPYDKIGPIASVNASNSRTAIISHSGRAYVFGDAGDDGRAGVERFLTKAGSQNRRQVDRDSCILTQPHQIGQFRDKYWKGGPGFRNVSVLSIALGKTHSAAICVPDDTKTKMPAMLPRFDDEIAVEENTQVLVENDYIIKEILPWKHIAHRSPKNLPNAKRDDVFRKDDDWWKLELKLMENATPKLVDETNA
jgi:alpha-tubulin suppressor-like RCC1 family protein